MNLLRTIIERLNQRIEVANIFDKQFGLCELNANGNDKAWVHYIGNGQAEVVTNFDAKNGTLFWAKRSKVTVSKTDAYKMSGCKQLYITTFPLTAYAIVRKSHLPCDSEDAQDWLASRIYKLASGTDPIFKQSIGVINYEVVPSGYINEIKTLTANYEWACVSVDVDVQVITSSEDGCYDTCATGDIPLPDLQPCTPCLTEVYVDGVTIIGNGTEADPLVAIGGGGGTPLTTQDEGVNVSTNTTKLNFTGAGVTASLISAGVVEVNVAGGGGGGGVTSVTGTAPIASSGGATPDISISQAGAASDGYLSSADWTTFDGKFDVPTGTNADYLDGTGTPTSFPTIPAAQIQSDWNQANNAALDFIKNKPTIPSTSGFVPYTGATNNVDLGTHTLSAKDLVINHTSGSGVAASITKGGAGEALTVVKSSGSGNAASITGGVTLISELHLTTDLADAYIASAATWNAKGNGTVTSVAATVPAPTSPAFSVAVTNPTTTPSVNITANGTTSQYVRGDGSLETFPNIPPFLPYITEVMVTTTATTNSIEYVPSVNKIYVTNGSNNVNIFNATTGELLATIVLTQALRARYINSINEVWVTSVNVASITRIDPSTNSVLGTITTSIVANGFDICEISSTKVYVSINGSGGAQRVQVINPSTLAFVADITASIPGFCSGMAFNNNPLSAQNGLVILGSSGGAVTLIDSATNTVTVATTNPSSALSNVYEIMYSAVDDKYYVSSQANSRVVSLNITGATTLTLDKIKYNAIANISLQIDDANDLLIINQIASTPTPNVMCHFIRKSTFESLYNIMTPAQGGANTRAGFVRADLVNKRVFLAGRSASSTAVLTVKY
jgi:hypothetical protein